jgi:hypothetical protein
MDNASVFISFQLGVLWVFAYVTYSEVRKLRRMHIDLVKYVLDPKERASDDK